ncbi:MAG: hypothetical protein ACKV2O_23715 [Acidimicrobiales bacterium]
MGDAAIVELSAAEVERLRKRYPDLRHWGRVVAVGVDDDPAADVLAALGSGPLSAVRKPASWEQARRNLAMRQRIVEEFGALSAAELGEWATPGAANSHQYASRLRKANRVFSVPFEGRTMFLGFQFDGDGRPLPALADTLALLRTRFVEGDWAVASWFTSPNPYLAGKGRPVDLLVTDPEAVIAAAGRGAHRVAS